MQLTVTGKQVDVGEALRRHVEASLDSLLGKYFRTAIEAHAVFTREAHLIRTDLSLHIGRGIIVKSGAAATDYYPAFDAAAERLGKQLRRYKRRLRDYHAKPRSTAERPETARMRLDLADAPALLFRNRSHGELNLVYRRGDGNIGWIDPALDTSRTRQRGAPSPRAG